MQGLQGDGNDLPIEATGGTRFTHPGDPTKNTGAGDTEYVDSDFSSCGDRNFLMGSGPFVMTPGDSQEVIYGIINVANGDPLESYLALKQVDVNIQNFVDNRFKTVDPPLVPSTDITALNDQLIITWGNESESYVENDNITAKASNDTLSQYIFEGYNVYQLKAPSTNSDKMRISTYDKINGVTEIYDDVFDEDYGLYVNVITQHGSDSGLQHSIKITNDLFNGNKPLLLNREYYFAVTAYAYNPVGIPKTRESDMEIIAVRPTQTNTWQANSDTIAYNYQFPAIHSDGLGGGSIAINIIDPTQITGDDYKVTFNDAFIYNGDTLDLLNWNLINTTSGATLLSEQLIEDGIDKLTGDTLGLFSTPIVDGFQVLVTGVNPDIDFVEVVANAGGHIVPSVDGLPWWRYPDWLVAEGNYDNQQTTGATWLLNTHPGYGPGGPDTFNNSVVAFSGGTGSNNQGIASLVPSDFECRFTGEGKAYDYFGGTGTIDVPFEWWNIGTGSSDWDGDDYKLIPYTIDDNDSGNWDLIQGDHETSGGDNDPYTDRIYVVAPTNNTPGTIGYDDFFENVNSDGSNVAEWTSAPGENDPGGPMDTWNVFSRLVFMNWNGGDVNDATWPANVNSLQPEIGTIFRIVTTKPHSSSDAYTFSTASLVGSSIKYSSDKINVWPNPYFGYNPEETGINDRQIHFTNLPEFGQCTIRIFDLAGNSIRKIDHTNGTQFEIWDLKNTLGKYIASGMYIVHIETEEGEKILKLAVIQPS